MGISDRTSPIAQPTVAYKLLTVGPCRIHPSIIERSYRSIITPQLMRQMKGYLSMKTNCYRSGVFGLPLNSFGGNLFRLSDKAGEAICEGFAMFVGGMFGEGRCSSSLQES